MSRSTRARVALLPSRAAPATLTHISHSMLPPVSTLQQYSHKPLGPVSLTRKPGAHYFLGYTPRHTPRSHPPITHPHQRASFTPVPYRARYPNSCVSFDGTPRLQSIPSSLPTYLTLRPDVTRPDHARPSHPHLSPDIRPSQIFPFTLGSLQVERCRISLVPRCHHSILVLLPVCPVVTIVVLWPHCRIYAALSRQTAAPPRPPQTSGP